MIKIKNNTIFLAIGFALLTGCQSTQSQLEASKGMESSPLLNYAYPYADELMASQEQALLVKADKLRNTEFGKLEGEEIVRELADKGFPHAVLYQQAHMTPTPDSAMGCIYKAQFSKNGVKKPLYNHYGINRSDSILMRYTLGIYANDFCLIEKVIRKQVPYSKAFIPPIEGIAQGEGDLINLAMQMALSTTMMDYGFDPATRKEGFIFTLPYIASSKIEVDYQSMVIADINIYEQLLISLKSHLETLPWATSWEFYLREGLCKGDGLTKPSSCTTKELATINEIKEKLLFSDILVSVPLILMHTKQPVEYVEQKIAQLDELVEMGYDDYKFKQKLATLKEQYNKYMAIQ